MCSIDNSAIVFFFTGFSINFLTATTSGKMEAVSLKNIFLYKKCSNSCSFKDENNL